MKLFWRAAVVVFVSVWWATPAGAQEIGNPDSGKRMAKEVCAKCHLVEIGQPPPADVGAPPFHDVMLRRDATEFWLRSFLKTPHRRMPNLRLTDSETDDIVAYMLGLKSR